MKLIQRFLALVSLVLLFIFCISNREGMTVRFLSWESLELPVFLLVFAFLSGAVLALLWQSLRGVSAPKEKKERKSKKDARKTTEAAEAGPGPAGVPDREVEAVVPEPVAEKTEGEN